MCDNNHTKQQGCPHGKCINHTPDWENIGKKYIIPSPRFFGLKKTNWGLMHCGKHMVIYKEIQKRKCKKCNMIDDHVERRDVLICSCCRLRTTESYQAEGSFGYGPS